ncbi:NifX-associated nitrogen fixation protein [Roseospira navarrensis]|uniref:NifX-associated nitrogen fixation protein n=1 Tax=Roseospira navarrensis TaxID=140058 RepID=A0A7X1ZG78_9PROT|nr:NifX-associated nitrogen fixation protein [Roseospira navarrensis]MQX37979.1 NifX-associated nitrogen fixation protein [Roseospira navarrensis]
MSVETLAQPTPPAGGEKKLTKLQALRAQRAAAATTPAPAWPDAPVFLPQLAELIRAGDCCGLWDGKTDARLLGGYVVDREKRKAIPILGEPDARVLRRLDTFYKAVSTAIGRRTDVIPTPVMELSDEGFGRVVLIAGRLVAVSRTLRDVHRFGFDSLQALDDAGATLVEEGVGMIEAHPDLATLA